jgi:hypothetical protein
MIRETEQYRLHFTEALNNLEQSLKKMAIPVPTPALIAQPG